MRNETRTQRIDRAIAGIAAHQNGIVTHAQLVALGLSRSAIAHRVATGRLQVLHRGVYAVGHIALTRRGIWLAAVFACGEGAVLSHRSAAELWRLRNSFTRPPEVSTPPGRRGHRVQGLRRHRSPIPPSEITSLNAIPVTTVPRTLLDMAAVVSRPELSRAFRAAEAKRWVTPHSLGELLERHHGRRGARNLRTVLADASYGTGITRSELEARFTRFLRRHGLPPPARNVYLRLGALDIEADCAWLDQRLIVELDGREFHDTGTAFEDDRARDRVLTVYGWRFVRVTSRQLDREDAQLARDLCALLGLDQTIATRSPAR